MRRIKLKSPLCIRTVEGSSKSEEKGAARIVNRRAALHPSCISSDTPASSISSGFIAAATDAAVVGDSAQPSGSLARYFPRNRTALAGGFSRFVLAATFTRTDYICLIPVRPILCLPRSLRVDVESRDTVGLACSAARAYISPRLKCPKTGSR